ARQVTDAQPIAARLRGPWRNRIRQYGARPSPRYRELLRRGERAGKRDVGRPARIGVGVVERGGELCFDRIEAVPFAQIAPRVDEVRERRRERRVGADRLLECGERAVLVSALPAC